MFEGRTGETQVDPDVARDYATALVGGGLPSSYHLASAIAEGDMEAAAYYLKLEAAVLGTQYSMLRFLNWYSPKNAITFKELHHGMSYFRQSAMMSGIGTLALGAAATYGVIKGVEYGIEKTFGERFRRSVRRDTRGGREYALFYTGN